MRRSDVENADVLELVDGDGRRLEEEGVALRSLVHPACVDKGIHLILLVLVIIHDDTKRSEHQIHLVIKPIPARKVGLQECNIFDTSREGGRAGVLEIGNKGYVEFTVRRQSVVVLQLPRVVPCWRDGLFLPILYPLRIPRSDHRVPSVLKESWLPGTQTRSNPQRAKNVVGATDYASSSTANCRQHGYRQRDGKADDEHPHRGSTHDHEHRGIIPKIPCTHVHPPKQRNNSEISMNGATSLTAPSGKSAENMTPVRGCKIV